MSRVKVTPKQWEHVCKTRKNTTINNVASMSRSGLSFETFQDGLIYGFEVVDEDRKRLASVQEAPVAQ
jgi:hypothetical protein